jgi:choline dehydrogenase-like flavoprotein
MYDFVLVGSGASGGVLAHNLTAAGAKCLLLEAGKYWNADTFPRSESAYATQLFWGGGAELEHRARLAFLRGRCVGGTTVVNQALLDRFDDRALNEWRAITDIDYFTVESMDKYYKRVEGKLKIHEFTDQELNRNAKLFVQGCERMGYKWHRLRRGQVNCRQDEGNDCLGCLGGCHLDSKQSTLLACIRKAEQQGLQVISECLVHEVDHYGDHVRIHGIRHNEKETFRARKCILAAGSFGTVKLLLQSGFGRQLPQLGRRFCTHPQFVSFGVFKEPVDAHKGALQTVGSKDPGFRKQGFKVANTFAPPVAVSMLLPVTGRDHLRIMRKYRFLSCIEVAIRDEPAGHLLLDKRGEKLIAKKTLTLQDKVGRDRGRMAAESIFLQAGAEEVIQSPYALGLHLMGGCAIGNDAVNSVVNEEFGVHGFENILIADSSIFPAAPGINPSLTIMALSQKLSDELIGVKPARVLETGAEPAETAVAGTNGFRKHKRGHDAN